MSATTAATLNAGGATLVGVVSGDTVTLNTAQRDRRLCGQERGHWQDRERVRL